MRCHPEGRGIGAPKDLNRSFHRNLSNSSQLLPDI